MFVQSRTGFSFSCGPPPRDAACDANLPRCYLPERVGTRSLPRAILRSVDTLPGVAERSDASFVSHLDTVSDGPPCGGDRAGSYCGWQIGCAAFDGHPPSSEFPLSVGLVWRPPRISPGLGRSLNHYGCRLGALCQHGIFFAWRCGTCRAYVMEDMDPQRGFPPISVKRLAFTFLVGVRLTQPGPPVRGRRAALCPASFVLRRHTVLFVRSVPVALNTGSTIFTLGAVLWWISGGGHGHPPFC